MRTSEIIVSTCGQYRKRVFKGQRHMVIAQRDENAQLLVTAFCTRAEAEQVNEQACRLGYQAHFIVAAAPQAVRS